MILERLGKEKKKKSLTTKPLKKPLKTSTDKVQLMFHPFNSLRV